MSINVSCECPSCGPTDAANSTIITLIIHNHITFGGDDEETVLDMVCPSHHMVLEVHENIEDIVIGSASCVGEAWKEDMDVVVQAAGK